MQITTRNILSMMLALLMAIVAVHIFVPEAHAEKGPVYYTALTAEPDSIDPIDIRNFFATHLGSQVLEGLLLLDEEMNIVPGAAESWEIKDYGREVVFHLRKDVRFHDGSLMKAADVAYSLRRLIRQDEENLFFKSFYDVVGAKKFLKGESDSVEGIVVLDEYTLAIKLTKPNPAFYKYLATVNCAIIPENYADLQKDKIKTYPVSIGPFKVKEWIKGEKIVLERHDSYYGGNPQIKYLVFYLMSDEQLVKAFEDGKVYDTFVASIYNNLDVSSDDHYVVRTKLPLLYFIALNARVVPFDNIYFRRALYHAMDRGRILKDVFVGEELTNSNIPYGIGGYSPYAESYGYDPERAKELLEQSKIPASMLKKQYTFYARTSIPNRLEFEKIVEGNFRAIGLNIKVEFITAAQFLKRFYDMDMEMFYVGHNINLNDARFVLAWYESRNKKNFTGTRSEKFDIVMEMAREEPDDYLRSRLYSKADRILTEDAAQIVLFNKKAYIYVSKKVRGYSVSGIGPTVNYEKVEVKL